MGALDDALRAATEATISVLMTSPATFSRTEPSDYATGADGATSTWSVLVGPPESMSEAILARGGLPPATMSGEVRFTVPATKVPADMVEPRTGDTVTLAGETSPRTVVAVEAIRVEEPIAYVVRARP